MNLVFNGREYSGADQTPAGVRRLYRIATSTAGGRACAAGPTRWIVAGPLIGAGLLLAALGWLGVI
jgi:hypothetical protein